MRDKTTSHRYVASKTAIQAVASTGPLLVLFAFTVPLTTLTSTAKALAAGPGSQAWVLSAMSVGAAAGLLSSGAMGDDYGRRKVFVFGALILALTSLMAALAPNGPVLVIARVLQGAGGAAILSCSLGLIGSVFEDGKAKANATGVWAACLGAGVAIGPLLSAALDHLGGWQMPYLVTAVAALGLGVAGHLVFSESRAAQPRRIDVIGTLCLSGGVSLILGALVEGRSGWDQPLVLVLMITGVLLILGFCAWERSTSEPMLDLSLFRHPDFVGATVAAVAAGAGVLSLVSFVPTLLERAMGIGPVTSACLILAWSATSIVTAFGARWLPDALDARTRLILGLVGVAIGQLALLLAPDSENALIQLFPGLLIAGIANGILNAALGYQAVSSVPADRAAMGSGANNTARYVGSSIGLAIVAVLVTHGVASGRESAIIHGWNQAVGVTAGVSLFGAAVVWMSARPMKKREAAKVSDQAS